MHFFFQLTISVSANHPKCTFPQPFFFSIIYHHHPLSFLSSRPPGIEKRSYITCASVSPWEIGSTFFNACVHVTVHSSLLVKLFPNVYYKPSLFNLFLSFPALQSLWGQIHRSINGMSNWIIGMAVKFVSGAVQETARVGTLPSTPRSKRRG